MNEWDKLMDQYNIEHNCCPDDDILIPPDNDENYWSIYITDDFVQIIFCPFCGKQLPLLELGE